MEPHSLQLALWRAACRHIDIADGVAELAAAVRAAVPVGPMRLFAIDAGRCVLAASDPPATMTLPLRSDHIV
jgi:hypothetical protein